MPQWFTREQVEEGIEAAVLPLRAEIAELMAQVERLQAENAWLKKDSSTSSKPPSSDIVKPKFLRDVKFLRTLPGREDQAYGQRVRDALRDLFAVIHRREKMTAAGFPKALEAAREQVLPVATTRVPKAIRFVVIDRHITQGTRSEKGRRWCERIWTVIATCAQQGRPVLQFLLDSVQAHFCGTSPPSLMPSGP